MGNSPYSKIVYGFAVDTEALEGALGDRDEWDVNSKQEDAFCAAIGLPRPDGVWSKEYRDARYAVLHRCPQIINWGGCGDPAYVIGAALVTASWDGAEILNLHEIEGASDGSVYEAIAHLCEEIGIPMQGCDFMLLTEYG